MSTSSFTKLRSHVKGSFILRADIEGQVSCSVSARDGLSIRDIFWEKLENTGGRKWENFLVYTKWTRVHIEWEMNCSCVRGHALLIINKLDKLPVPLPGAHHFIRKDVINAAVGRYCEKDFYYIIRPSGSAKNLGSFALVITTPSFPSGKSCIRHVTVAYNKDTDNFSLCSKEFDSLDSLVNYFKTTPIKAHNGPNMYLRNPIPVDPQLEEDCKKPWRTTRTGQRTADTSGGGGGGETDQTPDTISLWSCSSSLTPNSYSLSYDYDGSVSGLSCSEDDQTYEYNRSARDKFRCPTVINRDVPSPMSPVSDLSLSHHSYSDVEMRAQSGSSSGASQSGGSVSSSASFRRSQFYSDTTTKPGMKLQRPFSEVLRGGAEQCTIDPSRTKSVPHTFLVRQTPEGEICPIEPEETYVEMTPTLQKEFHLSAPSPCPEIRTDTMVRVDNEHSRTLTRGDGPEWCYINMNTINQEISALEPSETYVEMSQVRRPSPPSDHHVYVNRPARPASPSNTAADPRSSYDPVTTQKLIDNVQHLMVTVEEQAKEILTLKMTVKDLKLKMEALENYETQPYNYDH